MIPKNRAYILVLMAALNIGSAIIGTLLAWYMNGRGPFAVMVISIAIITFVSLLLINLPEDGGTNVDASSMRTAIAGTVIIVYLTLVILFSYFQYASNKYDLPLATQTLLTSFTSIVGVVVAFYFGASAYIQVAEKREERNKSIDDQKK